MNQLIINIIFGLLIITIGIAQLSYEHTNDKGNKIVRGAFNSLLDEHGEKLNSHSNRLADVEFNTRSNNKKIEGLQYWSSKDCPQGMEKVIASPGIDSTIVYPSLFQYTEDKGITINEVITDSVKSVCIGKKMQDEILEIIDTPFITK